MDVLSERQSESGEGMQVEAAGDEDNEEALEQRALALLNFPASLFECKTCHSFCNWKEITIHACVVKDKAYPDYATFLRKSDMVLCKPVGFQIDRVDAPEEFLSLFKLLESIVAEVVHGNEWRYESYKLPETHADAIAKDNTKWVFSCAPDTCDDPRCAAKMPTDHYGRPISTRHSFREMVRLSLCTRRLEGTESHANLTALLDDTSSQDLPRQRGGA